MTVHSGVLLPFSVSLSLSQSRFLSRPRALARSLALVPTAAHICDTDLLKTSRLRMKEIDHEGNRSYAEDGPSYSYCTPVRTLTPT
jgi:hypothetical protein